MAESPISWLRELGAVRPMAPTGEIVLVLGKWHNGFYPVSYRRSRSRSDATLCLQGVEEWHLYGEPCEPLTL